MAKLDRRDRRHAQGHQVLTAPRHSPNAATHIGRRRKLTPRIDTVETPESRTCPMRFDVGRSSEVPPRKRP